ncbi:hypothetical protein BH23GEM10_BH23GEM10_00300 [soil metagenome]
MTIQQSAASAGLLALVAIACVAAADAPAADAPAADATVAHATVADTRPDVAAATSQPTDAERSAVEAAARDYAEALYRAEPFRIERSVHRDLVKRGFFRDNQGVWQESMMTYQELHDLAGRWNADGRVTAAASPWRVTVLEVLDHTATARVTADWGIDHMHLARYNGEWKIIHVLWQEGKFD